MSLLRTHVKIDRTFINKENNGLFYKRVSSRVQSKWWSTLMKCGEIKYESPRTQIRTELTVKIEIVTLMY